VFREGCQQGGRCAGFIGRSEQHASGRRYCAQPDVSDHTRGKGTKRPQFEATLVFIREGDSLVCHSMDRLARNLDDLRRIVTELTKRGVNLEFVKESLAFTGVQSPIAFKTMRCRSPVKNSASRTTAATIEATRYTVFDKAFSSSAIATNGDMDRILIAHESTKFSREFVGSYRRGHAIRQVELDAFRRGSG